ncbi:hypothetical protein EJB05_18598 [Eragrostis curvula]|uniref:Epidermal patterning factor-like protein n=1 Tax=Eragrostis curvula TaxID=38414 RepID=A0A5J9VMA7_9POAL|nr:hypothetical protein EJB05_18598 [Eragrostis curvula]
MERSRRRRSMLKLAALCFVVVAVSLCCVWSMVPPRSDFRTGTPASCADQGCSRDGGQWQRRRLLSEGPGSYPPRCASKCGACSPCYPVHVAVPPGVPVTTEYYPEAWRCKCGNRLYMP